MQEKEKGQGKKGQGKEGEGKCTQCHGGML